MFSISHRGSTVVLLALIGISTYAGGSAQAEDGPPRTTFVGIEESRFVKSIDMLAEVRGVSNRLADLGCQTAVLRACTYLFGTAGLATATKKDGPDLVNALWMCGHDCKGEDVFSGVVLSLRLLAPGHSSNDYTNWLKAAGEAQRTKGTVRTSVGPVLITVTYTDALGTWIALSKPDQP